MHKSLTILGLLLVLTGCASVGLPQPESFDQKLAYAYGVHTAVETSAATAVSTGALSKVDGQAILTLADQSKALLDSAKQLETVDATTAGDKLALAVSVLTQVQTYIQSHGSAQP
jgi:hypothetical protein